MERHAFISPLGTYPHAGGCTGCRDENLCSACGKKIAGDHGRCTNGRCTECHSTVCGPGGATAPGHSYWRSPPPDPGQPPVKQR